MSNRSTSRVAVLTQHGHVASLQGMTGTLSIAYQRDGHTEPDTLYLRDADGETYDRLDALRATAAESQYSTCTHIWDLADTPDGPGTVHVLRVQRIVGVDWMPAQRNGTD